MHNQVRKIIKNMLFVAWISILFLITSDNVFADMLKIEDISTEFNQSEIVQTLNQFGIDIISKVNDVDKKIEFSVLAGEIQKKYSFVYTNEYIEYNGRDIVLTDENYEEQIILNFLIEGLEEAITKLSGYENIKLSDADYTNTYDEYGLQIETIEFKASFEEESDKYCKYFKTSLDDEKVDKLINKYGKTVPGTEEEIVSMTNPTLKIENVTENSVTLDPDANYYGDVENPNITCYIYRSEQENGTYEKISNISTTCSGILHMTITDNNLKNNTTYYYKVVARGGTKFSDPYAITTKKVSNDSNNNVDDLNNNNNKTDLDGNITENPQTGENLFGGFLTLIITGGLLLIIYSKNKYSLFN